MKNKNLQIQGLRAIAIIGIVIFHALIQFNNLYLNQEMIIPSFFVNIINKMPSIGVYTFFILSGLFMYNKKEFDLKTFYKNKFKKLYFPYLLCIIITFIITHIYYLPQRTVDFKELLLNIIMVNGFIGVDYVDGAHWYLTVLISFIISYGIMNYLKDKLRINKNIMVLIWLGLFDLSFLLFNLNSVGLLGSIQYWFNLLFFSWYPHYFLYFLCGICLSDDNDKAKIITLFIILIHSYYLYGLEFMIEQLILILVVYLCTLNRLSLLANKCLVYIGNLSYIWYLIHQNIIYVIELLLCKIFSFNVMTVILSILLSLIIAIMINKLIDNVIKYLNKGRCCI